MVNPVHNGDGCISWSTFNAIKEAISGYDEEIGVTVLFLTNAKEMVLEKLRLCS